MESLKEKLPMIIAVIIAIGILFFAYYFMFVRKDVYYTKIDNEKIEQVSSNDDMKYEYTLSAFNSLGKEKEIKFKTSRKLREDAYLELNMMIGRGVVNWKEVRFEELPEKVQEKY